MKRNIQTFVFAIFIASLFGCNTSNKQKSAAQILANPDYLAFSYGGYREKTRDIEPTIEQLKEDMQILAAMNVKILRTYNTKLQELPNLLEAIQQLKTEDPDFEMYLMVGTWIECEGAWTQNRNHSAENEATNAAEIQRAVEYANKYPDIVKIIAVGNEAMVRWAANYYVTPNIILKWVNYLQDAKKKKRFQKIFGLPHRITMLFGEATKAIIAKTSNNL